jgi:hypothetical protein
MPTLQDNLGRARCALTSAMRRREAGKSLIAFAQLTHPDYRPCKDVSPCPGGCSSC